ncbi:hypothetical protein ACSU1N_00755 [Thermogladius sp. 4427co]|uniref:hypothetical protein n=1 Tax=Thermogladius sp. 4427co TaxID=3450718 RepID=UPI003F7AB2E3
MEKARAGFRALTYGYLIRIFPIVALAGFIVSAYGWYRVYQGFKQKLILASIAGVALIVGFNIFATLAPSNPAPQLSENSTSTEMINALTALDRELGSPLTVLALIVPSIGLLLESLGFIELRRSGVHGLSLALITLFYVYTGLFASHLALIPGLRSSIRGVAEGLSTGALNTTRAWGVLSEAYIPYNILDFATLISSIVSYMALALAFHRLSRSS